MNVPVILYDARGATESWEAYAALCQREQSEPSLLDNPQWRMLKRIAFSAFEASFVPQNEVLQ